MNGETRPAQVKIAVTADGFGTLSVNGVDMSHVVKGFAITSHPSDGVYVNLQLLADVEFEGDVKLLIRLYEEQKQALREECGATCEDGDDCDRSCIRPEGHEGRCLCKNHHA